MLDWPEIAIRLGVATLAGGAIGLDRDLHGKPIGLKTLGLVGLATAMVVMLAVPADDHSRIADATSRVIQGILTGIGFLGAGVIVRGHGSRVHGLTSAACAWFAACAGIACGVGQWRIVIVGLAIAFVLLLIGRPLERRLHHLLGGKEDADDKSGGTPAT